MRLWGGLGEYCGWGRLEQRKEVGRGKKRDGREGWRQRRRNRKRGGSVECVLLFFTLPPLSFHHKVDEGCLSSVIVFSGSRTYEINAKRKTGQGEKGLKCSSLLMKCI